MSDLLTDPTAVVTVGFDRSSAEELEAQLTDGISRRVESAAEAATAAEAAGTDDVGCVIVGDETGLDPVETCATVADAEPLVPVVAVVANGDGDLAHEFLRAGGSQYVPRSRGIDAVAETVEDAIDRYRRLREDHAQSTMFTSLLEESSVPLYAKDTDARYVRKSVVPAGRNPSELIGKTDPEVYTSAPQAATQWYQDDLKVISSEEGIYDQEERLETAEGEHWSRTTKIPWYDGDELRGLMGISFDITQYVELRYRLEEYRERFEKFADSVAHDLHNPLQVAAGNLELAREADDQEALDKAAAALDRIEEMIDDLSEVAREEQQTLSRSRVADRSFETVDLEPLDMPALIRDVWEVLDTNGATLECGLPDDTRIYGPEAAIRPVIENLLKNAVRHAGPAPTVHIDLLPEGGFYVEDDGPGIPEEIRDRVFRDGFTTSEEGSGTGLSLVSDIADSQGWTVGIEDGDLGGARIEVRNCLLVGADALGVPAGEELSLTEATNVGDFDVEGEAEYDEDTGQWTVVGGGMNIWQQTNEFYYVHTELDGPVSIEARVVDLEDVGQYSKAGVMVRDSTDEDATYGHIGIIPDDRTEVLWRTDYGEDGVSQFVDRDLDATPWLRVDRVGDTVTVAVSDDGEEWMPVNERRVDLTDAVHVGLVVCSFRPNSQCTGVFNDVRVRRLEAEE